MERMKDLIHVPIDTLLQRSGEKFQHIDNKDFIFSPCGTRGR